MPGSAASSTSPTTCRLRALTASSVSRAGVPGVVVEVDDVDRRHAGREKGQVVVFDGRRRRNEGVRQLHLRRRRQMMSVSHGVEFESRRDAEVAVADHVDEHHRLERGERAVAPGRLDVAAAAVGVIVARATRRPPPRRPETPARSSDDSCGAFSTRAISSRNAALDPPSLAPTNAEFAKQLRVVVAGDGHAIAARARNGDDEIDHVHPAERRLLVPRLIGGVEAHRLQLLSDVLAGLLDGRRTSRPRSDADHLLQVSPRRGWSRNVEPFVRTLRRSAPSRRAHRRLLPKKICELRGSALYVVGS